uniref:Uncharacterized protein n=1 Tax=Anolis carolinensis TaxID=28377 RepID=A0A803SWH9_ANOCA
LCFTSEEICSIMSSGYLSPSNAPWPHIGQECRMAVPYHPFSPYCGFDYDHRAGVKIM